MSRPITGTAAARDVVVVIDIQRGFADPELLPWVPADSIGEGAGLGIDVRSGIAVSAATWR